MIIAFDLGTKTGFAAYSRHTGIVSGVKDFSTKRTEGAGMRYLKFKRWLDSIKDGIEEVYYEEVKRHAGTQAAHVYGAFQGALMAWCEENNIPYESVPVGVIKKSWSGKGNSGKEEMIAEAIKRGFNPVDDNQADALALLHYVFDMNLKVA